MAKNWKQPTGVMSKEIILYPFNKILLINKMKELLVYARRWMKLKNIMLSKRHQTHKSAYYVASFM